MKDLIGTYFEGAVGRLDWTGWFICFPLSLNNALTRLLIGLRR